MALELWWSEMFAFGRKKCLVLAKRTYWLCRDEISSFSGTEYLGLAARNVWLWREDTSIFERMNCQALKQRFFL